MTEITRSVHRQHARMRLVSSEVFISLVDGKLSQIICSACLCLATDLSLGDRMSINTIKKIKDKTLQTLFIKYTSL